MAAGQARHPDQSLAAITKDTRVLERVNDGLTLQEIADEFGVSKSVIWRRYQRAKRRIPEQAETEYKAAQLARIAVERVVAEDIINGTHPVVSNGKVFRDLEDAGPKLAAINALVKLDAQESDLLGLKAPVKSEVDLSGGVRYEVVGVDPGGVV